ncbi:MAG: hypothetical protein A2340_05380 [Lentisphaerae bacterium RIFOXYB12_FULL_60_10]|nr:MAG: hypothetical protein A2269_05825 [Lentisphaerae bacterium RIFOXYA12_FULL_60_10]OGV84732.1 MAG: hypothetical protein A2340_05380 [Lentisphaerae bacterium RIFOXYB12_FULL_60_10]
MTKLRTILHLDMDAFFASVEQLDHPAWRGKPVIVGAAGDKRGVVAAASYEARVFGVHSAMPSREAARRCPHAIFTPPRGERYEAVSRQVFAILEQFTPLVEPLSIDEAFLDVTGAARLFGDGPCVAERIRERILAETHLTASVGVATNKFLAKLASDLNKPDGITVVPVDPDAIRAFLAPLPVRKLWGVGAVTGRLLESAGLRTIGDVQGCGHSRLAALLGRDAARDLQALSRGEDDRSLELSREEKSISREHTFDQDCEQARVVEAMLIDLVEDVGIRLRAGGYYAECVRIKVRWSGFETLTRQRQLPAPVCDDFTLRDLAHALWREVGMRRPVRLIGFGVSRLVESVSRQIPLFEADDADTRRRERLSRTVDGLRRRFGKDVLRRLE